MKRILTIIAIATALMAALSSCKKDDSANSKYPCFVSADNFDNVMPSTLELKLADKGYYSRCSFVPYDGKTNLKYDGENSTCLKIEVEPRTSIFNGSFTADMFGLEGWAFGFAAGSTAQVGDKATATITYNYNGVSIEKTVTLKVVD